MLDNIFLSPSSIPDLIIVALNLIGFGFLAFYLCYKPKNEPQPAELSNDKEESEDLGKYEGEDDGEDDTDNKSVHSLHSSTQSSRRSSKSNSEISPKSDQEEEKTDDFHDSSGILSPTIDQTTSPKKISEIVLENVVHKLEHEKRDIITPSTKDGAIVLEFRNENYKYEKFLKEGGFGDEYPSLRFIFYSLMETGKAKQIKNINGVIDIYNKGKLNTGTDIWISDPKNVGNDISLEDFLSLDYLSEYESLEVVPNCNEKMKYILNYHYIVLPDRLKNKYEKSIEEFKKIFQYRQSLYMFDIILPYSKIDYCDYIERFRHIFSEDSPEIPVFITIKSSGKTFSDRIFYHKSSKIRIIDVKFYHPLNCHETMSTFFLNLQNHMDRRPHTEQIMCKDDKHLEP